MQGGWYYCVLQPPYYIIIPVNLFIYETKLVSTVNAEFSNPMLKLSTNDDLSIESEDLDIGNK